MSSRERSKGRKVGRRFAMIPLCVLEHPAVVTLSHACFRVLVLLAGTYNGRNNGALGITAKQAADHGIGSQVTFYRSLRELESRGLIRQTYPASRVPPRPTMYAITWQSLDDTDFSNATKVAGNEYRSWKP